MLVQHFKTTAVEKDHTSYADCAQHCGFARGFCVSHPIPVPHVPQVHPLLVVSCSLCPSLQSGVHAPWQLGISTCHVVAPCNTSVLPCMGCIPSGSSIMQLHPQPPCGRCIWPADDPTCHAEPVLGILHTAASVDWHLCHVDPATTRVCCKFVQRPCRPDRGILYVCINHVYSTWEVLLNFFHMCVCVCMKKNQQQENHQQQVCNTVKKGLSLVAGLLENSTIFVMPTHPPTINLRQSILTLALWWLLVAGFALPAALTHYFEATARLHFLQRHSAMQVVSEPNRIMLQRTKRCSVLALQVLQLTVAAVLPGYWLLYPLVHLFFATSV